jgi:outer membrane protein TolC
VLILLLVVLVFNAAGAASVSAQALPAVRVAFVHDRSAADWAVGFRDSLRLEIDRILEVDYTVETPAELDQTADGTVESVQAAPKTLLGTKQVDLIVATGPLGSREAGHMSALAPPVIGTWVLDPEVQQVPFKDGTSGRHNFTYITVGNLLRADMTALNQVVEYNHLVVIGSAGWMAALPGDGSALDKITDSRTSFVTGDGTVESILGNLPDDADAIYLMPMIDMSSSEISALLTAFTERKLPVLSLVGEPEVRDGALVGAAPGNWRQRMYRRVALVAAEILSGTEPADIPVMMMRDDRMFLNMRTANLIGVSPPFEVIIEAVMIDEIDKPGTETIDLYGAMTTAQAQNRDIASTESAVAAGHEQVNIAKAELLPQIHLGLDGRIIDKDNAAWSPILSERTVRGNAAFSQLIYSDGAWAGYSIEKHLQEARVGELDLVRLDVGLEAATAYLDVLRAQTRLQIQRQNLTFSRTNLERAQVRVSVGDANRSELYRWESKIASEQAQVMQAAVNRRLATLELNRVLDQPLEVPLELVDSTLDDQYLTLVPPRVDNYTRDPRSLEVLRDFLVQKGLEGSPELQQFDASILATEREHSAATRSFWVPDIGLTGGVNHVFSRSGEGSNTIDPLAPDDTFWNVGMFVSLPLFEGAARFAETRRTTQDTYRLMRGRQATAQRIEQNVRNSVFQVAASRLAIDLGRTAAEAARLNLELVADNYTMGRVSLVDLLDAQTNSLNADLAAIDAINDYLIDLMLVERAVGQFTFFVPEEQRAAWIQELEEFDRQRP